MKTLLFAVFALFAVSPTQGFDVRSIKPANPGTPGMSVQTSPGRFLARGATVAFLIQYAYGVQPFEVFGGPDWIGSERYEIEGRFDGDDTAARTTALVREMLADRFKFRFHHETRQLQVYTLSVAKNGPKLNLPTAGKEGARSLMRSASGQLNASNQSIAGLSTFLTRLLGRRVLDRTELTGSYDFTLQWTPDENQSPPLRPDGPVANPNGPSIFTALQEQLGLRLESGRAPADVLIIDGIEIPPSN